MNDCAHDLLPLVLIRSFARDDHPQCERTHAVVKRRLHMCDLSIHRHPQTMMLRRNPNLLRAQRQKLFLVPETAEESMPRKLDQTQPSGAIGYVETQLPRIKTRTSTNIKTLHFIFIVADENKRRASRELVTINTELDIEKGIATQDRNRCPHKRRPFARSQSLLLLTLTNNTG